MPRLLAFVEQGQGRRDNRGKALRAVLLQEGNAQIHDRGHRSHLDVVVRDAVFHVPSNSLRRQRRAPLTGQRLDRVPIPDEHRHFPADGTGPVIGDVECYNRAGSGIGRIAALAENFNTSGYGPSTTSRNDAGFALGLPADLIYPTHVLLLVEKKMCRV